MKKNLIFILILIPIMGWSKIIPFDSNIISIQQPFAHVYTTQSILYFSGSVIRPPNHSFSIEITLSHFHNTETLFYEKLELLPTNPSFSVQIPLSQAGLFWLGISSPHFPYQSTVITVLDTAAPQPNPPAKITDIQWGSHSPSDSPLLQWKSNNELTRITVQQDTQEQQFWLTNQAQQFYFPRESFAGWQSQSATFLLQGARSENGSRFHQNSVLSEPVSISAELTLYYPIEHAQQSLTMNHVFPIFCQPDTCIHFSGTSSVPFFVQAKIRKPSLTIESIPIQCSSLQKESSLNPYYLPGEFHFSYTFSETGIYFLELLNAQGIIILNTPIYCYPNAVLPMIPEDETPITTSPDRSVDFTLDYINYWRQQIDLPLLTIDFTLNRMAQDYAEEMVRKNFLGHVSPTGKTLKDRCARVGVFRPCAENIARGKSIQSMNANLQRSPAHFEQIVNPHWRQVGIGIAHQQENWVIVQVFSAPWDDDARQRFLEEVLDRINQYRNALPPLHFSTQAPSQRDPYRVQLISRHMHGLLQHLRQDKVQRILADSKITSIYIEKFQILENGILLELVFF